MTNDILRHYIPLVKFLGNTLGPDYEIVLHDLTLKQPAIIAITNKHISGRDMDAPLTNMAMQTIAEKSYTTQDWKLNYRGQSANGKILRCSTLYIKDGQGKLIGLLCINFDDSRFRDISEQVFALCHPNKYVTQNIAINTTPLASDNGDSEQETFYNSISAATEDALLSVVNTLQVPADRLTQTEKLKILQLLDEKGLFMLKGVVPIIAQKLSCSPASIYRYLSKIRLESQNKTE